MNKLVADDLGLLAYGRIKKMILENRLIPGKKIVQEKLAAELGISRTPLRTALQMLEAEYLVKSIPRRGMVVREFSNREIAEVYDCRIALESTAVRLFTELESKKHIAELKQFFRPFEGKAAGDIDTKAYQKADSQFHDALIKHCGNGFLTQLFNKGNLLIWINRIGLIRPPEETLPEHLAIIDAIERADVEAAESLAKIHLDKSKRLILKLMANEK